MAEIADVVRVRRDGWRRLRRDGLADLDQVGTIDAPGMQHTAAQCRRDLDDHLGRLQADAFDIRGMRWSGTEAQQDEDERRGERAHARHYSTPSRFTAR